MRGVLILLAVSIAVCSARVEYEHFNKKGCGERPFKSKEDDGKVVGGVESKNGDHKWMVALFRSATTNSLSCGGSILNNRTILTAAHCTQTSGIVYSIARTHTINPRESWSQRINVSKVVNHEAYSGSTFNNDISLLFLQDELKFDDYTGPVCLTTRDPDPEPVSPDVDELCMSSGWGSTFSGGSVVNVLRENTMNITKDSACKAFYQSSYNPTTMICAGYTGDGLDTCQGDSGGPLTINEEKGGKFDVLYQVGIVSWGRGCGNVGVYTRVSNYLGWIDRKMKEFFGENN